MERSTIGQVLAWRVVHSENFGHQYVLNGNTPVNPLRKCAVRPHQPRKQQQAYNATFNDATYKFSDFKAGVAKQLADSFGALNVNAGDRAFHIKPNSARRSADVVACFQYRRYVRFISRDDYKYYP